MQRRPSHTLRADFTQQLIQKFPGARLLVIGAGAELPPADDRPESLPATSYDRLAELAALPQNGSAPGFDLALWFYPALAEAAEEGEALLRLTKAAAQILLLPSTNADAALRRPELVQRFVAQGFFPDYEAAVTDLQPEAILLRRRAHESAAALIATVETEFARINSQLHAVRWMLRTRMAELEAADEHIARLEEKVLQLKKTKRDLKQLKAEKQALRKSPERKIGQVLLAPYRLPQKLIREIRKHRPRPVPPNEYQLWLRRHQATGEELARMREESRAFATRPLISVITPVFNTPPQWLKEAADSVRQQAYENWELMLVDDGSTDPETLRSLNEIASSDTRIHLLRRKKNGGISVASNDGIEAAQGEWIGLLDHDDFLEPDALYQTARLLQQHPDADLTYSDEDKLTEEGLAAPFFKPDWSPDLFLSFNYVCHFATIRRALVRQVGGFRSEFDFAQDYDLYLRVIAHSPRIYHIPRILYHWRRSEGSTSVNIRAKPEALDAARNAISAYLERIDRAGHVSVDWNTHAFRIRREIAREERIAIIIPTRDRIDLLERCLTSVERKTTYQNYEIVIVDNDSRSDEAREFFQRTPHRVLHFAGPFNYSAINNFAVAQTDAPWLLFLNNDAEVISDHWLTTMAEHVQRPAVGAVGAQLIFRDDTIQHAGIVLGVRGTAKHAFCGFPAGSPGVCRQLQVTRNYSAVTAACLLTRREVFEQVGGFDEERLPVIFNDVDLCLKMRAAGYLIVYTPFARLYHDESATRRPSVEPMETEILRARWPEAVTRDPYYNPNLSRDQADFSLGDPRGFWR